MHCVREHVSKQRIPACARQAAREIAAGPPKRPQALADLLGCGVQLELTTLPVYIAATPQMLDWMRWAMADSDSPEKVSPTCGCSSTAGNSGGQARSVSGGACAEATYTKALEQAETTK